MTRESTLNTHDVGPPGPAGGPSVVRPTPDAIGRLRPLNAGDVRLDGGFWAERQGMNRARTIPHGFAQLQATGTLGNLRLAAGASGGGCGAGGVVAGGVGA